MDVAVSVLIKLVIDMYVSLHLFADITLFACLNCIRLQPVLQSRLYVEECDQYH